MQPRVFEMDLAGKKLIVETGRYAEQAGGNCIVRYGDTAVMANATAASKPREGIDFFPLSIDFEEKMYAVGKIPGGFLKKEGRPSDRAILTSRLIDRPLRPLFPKGYYNDVQVVITTMSVDKDIPPAVFGMIGSSVALSISDIPFLGPTGSIVVGYVDGEYIINPNSEQRAKSLIDLTVSGTKDAVMMVEAGAKVVSEQIMLDAILFAHEEIKKIVEFIEGIVKEIGKPKKDVALSLVDEAIDAEVREFAKDKVVWSVDTIDRQEREDRRGQAKEEIMTHFEELYPEKLKDVDSVLYSMTKEVVRDKIINKGIRPDGRKYDEIRPIWGDTSLFPRTHGSAVFTRGQTQVINITTLGAIGDGQTLDGISEEDFKRYMHQYIMPPYSTGEAKPIRSASRREVGHGALAERAIEPMLPDEADFPYAIRTVSEVVSSNGSTSQASVCASSMSLMDAGVPMKAAVAGVAMGLIKDQDNGNIAILTDIQGLEDFFGDMDFKVAGTSEGITAIQMDIKIKGIDKEILTRALEQARKGRLFILDKMNEVLAKPREDLSPYAPKIIQFTINPEKIREVIGSGGKVINKIIQDTGVKIDIEDDGRVSLTTPDSEAAKKAKNIIMAIATDIEAGNVYDGVVTRIMNFGAFVEVAPGKEGMVHISKLANYHVDNVEDFIKEGDKLKVVVAEIDRQGRVNLSAKGLNPEREEQKRPKYSDGAPKKPPEDIKENDK